MHFVEFFFYFGTLFRTYVCHTGFADSQRLVPFFVGLPQYEVCICWYNQNSWCSRALFWSISNSCWNHTICWLAIWFIWHFQTFDDGNDTKLAVLCILILMDSCFYAEYVIVKKTNYFSVTADGTEYSWLYFLACRHGTDIDIHILTWVARMIQYQVSSCFFVVLQLGHFQRLHATHLML